MEQERKTDERKKSAIEQILDLVPDFRQRIEDWSEGRLGPEEVYRELRLAERCYEQLNATGVSCEADLLEKRLQIMDYAFYLINLELQDPFGLELRDSSFPDDKNQPTINRKTYRRFGPRFNEADFTTVRAAIDKIEEYAKKIEGDSKDKERKDANRIQWFQEPD